MSNQEKIDNESVFRFRPAARHILTIGRGLVKDATSAIIELIKNAYDADASKVSIIIEKIKAQKQQSDVIEKLTGVLQEYIPNPSKETLDFILETRSKTALFEILKKQITLSDIDRLFALFAKVFPLWEETKAKTVIHINDNGHGMTRETFLNSWLVPSTLDKVKNTKSKKGRFVQGQKGIGRYATSMLGDILVLTSTAQALNGGIEQTNLALDWSLFSNGKYEYLDQVPISLKTVVFTNNIIGTPSIGTSLEITSYDQTLLETSHSESLGELTLEEELSKIYTSSSETEDDFVISIEWKKNGEEEGSTAKIIERNDFDAWHHHQMSGTMKVENGLLHIDATYQNKNKNTSTVDSTPISTRQEFGKANFGNVSFSFKVFDLDTLMDDGKGKTTAPTKNDIRKISGISIFRNGFKIRPYGESKAGDWLGLNQRRVNTPALRLSTNQIIGLLEIESEEQSGIEEQSSRDGLKDTAEFNSFKEAVLIALSELERIRYKLRYKLRHTPEQKASEYVGSHRLAIQKIENKIIQTLTNSNVSSETTQSIQAELDDIKKPNDKLYQAIISYEKEVAIYHVQAAAAKVAMVIVHDASNKLAFINNKGSICAKKIKKITKKQLELYAGDPSNDTLSFVGEGLEQISLNSEAIGKLMKTLSIVAIQKLPPKKKFDLISLIHMAKNIYSNKLTEYGINFRSDLPKSLEYNGREADFLSAFTNLLDNSIHWLQATANKEKYLQVTHSLTPDEIVFLIEDNGKGITKADEPYIFAPGFTTKSSGTGLGLAIAGEALKRNNCELGLMRNEQPTIFFIKIPLNQNNA